MGTARTNARPRASELVSLAERMDSLGAVRCGLVALVLIVGAFLLVQDRLDRRDPRLALAPVGPDVLGFT